MVKDKELPPLPFFSVDELLGEEEEAPEPTVINRPKREEVEEARKAERRVPETHFSALHARPKIIRAYLAQVRPRASDIASLTPTALCVVSDGDDPVTMTIKGSFPRVKPDDVELAYAYWGDLTEEITGMHCVPIPTISWSTIQIVANHPFNLQLGGYIGFQYTGLREFAAEHFPQHVDCFEADEVLCDTAPQHGFIISPKPRIKTFTVTLVPWPDQHLTPVPNDGFGIAACQDYYIVEWDVELLPPTSVISGQPISDPYALWLDLPVASGGHMRVDLTTASGSRQFQPMAESDLPVTIRLGARNECGEVIETKTIQPYVYVELVQIQPQFEPHNGFMHLFENQVQICHARHWCVSDKPREVELNLSPGFTFVSADSPQTLAIEPGKVRVLFNVTYVGEADQAQGSLSVTTSDTLQSDPILLKGFRKGFKASDVSVSLKPGEKKTIAVPIVTLNEFRGEVTIPNPPDSDVITVIPATGFALIPGEQLFATVSVHPDATPGEYTRPLRIECRFTGPFDDTAKVHVTVVG